MPIGDENGVKICLVGSSTVGKSSIVDRLVHDEFHVQTKITVGCEYSEKDFTVNGETTKLRLWNTAGNKRYRDLVQVYCRGASAIVLVYDITNEKSFQSLRTFWVPSLRACTNAEVALAIVGNKLDLETTGRVVSAEEGQGYAEILEAVFLETSAKTGHNVERIFTELIMKIKKTKKTSDQVSEERRTIRLPESADPGQEPNGDGVRADGTPAKKKRHPACKIN